MYIDPKRTLFPPRSFCGLVLVLLASLVPIFSQVQSDVESQRATALPVNLPKTPSSPAFFLMGIEPVSVDRPTTPKDLVLSIIGNLSDLAENPDGYLGFALEYNLYWHIMKSRKYKPANYKSYASNDNPFASSWQTLSISLATVPGKRIGPNTGEMSAGVGVRFSPFPGEISSSYEKKLSRLLAEFDTPFETELGTRFDGDPVYTELNRRRYLESGDPMALAKTDFELVKRENEILRELGSEFAARKIHQKERIDQFTSRTPQKRVGCKLEFALATTFDFLYTWLEDPEDSTKRNFEFDEFDPFKKSGAWLTTGYEGPKTGLFVTGRLSDNSAYSDGLKVDGALRLAYDPTKRFSLSGEGMYSYLPGDDARHIYRLDAILEWNCSRFSGSLTAGWDSYNGFFLTLIGDGDLIKSIRPYL